MSNLVPIEPGMSLDDSWGWKSPSSYWKVTSVTPVRQTGRQAFHSFAMLLIEFSHTNPDGDRIVVQAYISNKADMLRLKSFLDASVDLPAGIRMRIHTEEKTPWDAHTPRGRDRHLPPKPPRLEEQ